ncbi:MAG: amidase [Burkholderiales bacterium]|nr:amidase [Burkholderiales bacterium]
MRFDEYIQHDALSLADLVRRGEVLPTELLDLATARADQTHPQLNAVVTRLDAQARQRCTEPFESQAPFSGVPFLLKDLFQDIQGQPTSCGSRALARTPVPDTSDVVRRWQAAGLVIFGKTNCPEFGAKNITESLLFGPARNPWDLTRTPGGSSGGSAAAVAAGVVPVAGANDGGGSTRIPASACGLFGFKAGRGRISMGPAIAEAMHGAAVHGVVSRSVRDTAAMMDVLQGPEPHAPYYMPAPQQPYLEVIRQSPGRLRIGFSTASPIGTPVDPQAVAAVHSAAKLLESLGHHVEEASPPVDGQAVAQDFFLAWFSTQAMIVDMICQITGARLSDFEPDTRMMARVGRSVSAREYLIGQGRWNEHNRALSQFHHQHDAWLSPTTSAPPLRIGELTTPKLLTILGDVVTSLGLSGWLRRSSAFQSTALKNLAWTPYTQLANLTGRPAMSVPLHWTPDGLPMGVQFVAGLNGEAMLLKLAAQLEQAQPWFARRPSL